jgi:hypothetical protein
MAVGANRQVIARGLLKRLIRVVAVSLIVGGGFAALSEDLLAAYLFSISSRDPLTVAAAAAAITATALAAAWPGIRRATHVDPATALRAE